MNNNMEMLKWVRKGGCPWNTWTFSYATENGHIDILRWARSLIEEEKCPWNKWTVRAAACNGHLAILDWVLENDGYQWWIDELNLYMRTIVMNVIYLY